MINYILVDSSSVIVGAATIPDADLAMQEVPDGCTRHLDVIGRPLLDSFVGGVVIQIQHSRTIAELKTDLLAKLAEARWRIETGGVICGGVRIETDDRSKLLISDAARRAEADPLFTVRWKSAGGWVDLGAAALISVRDAVFAHVAACFARESELAAAIDAAPGSAELDALADDIARFWPQ